jgi:glycerol-3-phosphate dehydrogenase
MRRDIAALSTAPLDLLIIGGGVYGICAAWEAARRGLAVALIERGDFGGATSGNSLHTMHGGLRYLQHLDIRRMRESIRERRFWMRVVPDLVTPMPFVLPTSGHGLRGPAVMQAALLLNDIISADRNAGVEPRIHLPSGRRLTRAQAAQYLGPLRLSGYNGAALWYDGFSTSPERVLVGLLNAAHGAGAKLANYCEAVNFTRSNGGVSGAVVRDCLLGSVHTLRARFVLNAAGPWVDAVATLAGRRSREPMFHPSRGLNLVVSRLPLNAAIGVPVRRKGADQDVILDKGSVTYFIIPWGNYSLIGTKHLHGGDVNATSQISAREIADLLAEINPILGNRGLTLADVVAIKCGLLPARPSGDTGGEVELQKHARVVDHAGEDGIDGFLSVVGVKWTTARLVAERAVELICARLRWRGGYSVCPISLPRVAHIEGRVGTKLVSDADTTTEQIRHAARYESALMLSDAVLRRTDLWLSRQLDRRTLLRVAGLMAIELAWSAGEIERQVDVTLMELDRRQSWRMRSSVDTVV